MTQDDDTLAAETARVSKLLEGIQTVCNESGNTPDIYATLVFALGRVISLARDPAELLCVTIPKLASAAQIKCQQLGDLDELEEALGNDSAQSTH
jgi:hypothetical protein